MSESQPANILRPSQILKPVDFGVAVHQFTRHSATVQGVRTEEELLDPRFWSSVSGKLTAGDEIRVLADDMTFRAELLCTYAYGTEIRMVCLDYLELDEVDYDALDSNTRGYEAKFRGQRQWCIIKIETGEVIRDHIVNQSQAIRELEQYCKALAS